MTLSSVQSAMPATATASRADAVLKGSVYTWFVLALCGQWLFAVYILARYGSPVLSGDYQSVNQGNHIGGYQPGAGLYNLIYFGHILPVILLGFGGILQFVPQMRRRLPRLHRWNGRLFFTLGISGAITGLYLIWGAGNRLSDLGAIGITLNGLLIPLAIVLAWRYAIAGQFKAHQRWAVHSFLLVNGVWSFRLYLFGWFVLHQGPYGNNSKLDGPVDLFFSFACYLLPMAVAELVLLARRQRHVAVKWAVAGLMVLGSAVTLGGIAAIGFVSWLPVIMA